MPSTVLLGAQWGDEGKGKITDLISSDYDYVVRYQGGNNAGIVCCWYNREGHKRDGNLRIDYEIQDLRQIKDILGANVERQGFVPQGQR